MPRPSFDPSRALEIIAPSYGSGYRISSRLVLTAKHLFPDGDRTPCRVRAKQTFGETDAKVVWVSSRVDIALIELPDGLNPCDPIVFGRLPAQQSSQTLPCEVCGWPKWAQTIRSGRPTKSGRRHITGTIYLADTPSEDGLLVWEPKRVPRDPLPGANTSEWGGLSGAAVLCHGLIVAVQHQHQNSARAASLEATSLATIYEDETWRRLMQQHGFAAEPQNVVLPREEKDEDFQSEVVASITSKLNRLTPELRKQVATEIYRLAGGETSGINLKESDETRVPQTAACMVNRVDVSDVVGCLVGLMQAPDDRELGNVADIVNYLLPLNYAPDAVRRLYKSISENQFGFLEDEVSTRTFAEILMAGYDKKPAKFHSFTADNDLRGPTALDYQEGPEEGPENLQNEPLGILRAARNLLLDLLALKDTTSGLPRQPQRPLVTDSEEADLRRDLDACVIRLRGALKGISNLHKRTVYCVLKMPSQQHARNVRKQVLREVHHYIPQIVFVELAPVKAKREREFEVQQYITHMQFRLIHTQ